MPTDSGRPDNRYAVGRFGEAPPADRPNTMPCAWCESAHVPHADSTLRSPSYLTEEDDPLDAKYHTIKGGTTQYAVAFCSPACQEADRADREA